MARNVNIEDEPLSKILKALPSEIVVTYTTFEAALRTSFSDNSLRIALWIAAGLLFFTTPLWLHRVMQVTNKSQLLISTLAFPIWLFAIGGPFTLEGWYKPGLGAAALPLYSLLFPLILGAKADVIVEKIPAASKDRDEIAQVVEDVTARPKEEVLASLNTNKPLVRQVNKEAAQQIKSRLETLGTSIRLR